MSCSAIIVSFCKAVFFDLFMDCRSSLRVVYCLLFVVRCALFVVCSLLYVMMHLLFGAC